MYADRREAGCVLAVQLERFMREPTTIVLGIPRGGVIVSEEVADALDLPLDLAVAAKVGSPGNPEYAVGAVAADGVVTPSWVAGYSADEIEKYAGPAREKVRRVLKELRRDRPPLGLAGRTALIVDDGLATGLTAIAAVEWARREGAASVIVAVPVASRDAVEAVMGHADEVIAVQVPSWFSAVGQFYEHFTQTEGSEVIAVLERHPASQQ